MADLISTFSQWSSATDCGIPADLQARFGDVGHYRKKLRSHRAQHQCNLHHLIVNLESGVLTHPPLRIGFE